ncbi:MAG: glycosyltransferase family 39 protein [Anaerolineae bacterium]|nr:glycosyltransferase family 39 protein [Anaerolineae bacterium]
MKPRVFVLVATLILLGASFLRLADLHRYPPALHYDEAADMLLSRDVAWFGYRPFPVVTAYSGREALFYYIAAPMLRIFGTDVMATRLTSAFLGILTVAATIALGKAMFKHRGIALLAGAWLAVNGAQIWLTRQGFRTSPQPLLEALALWLLWVALRRQQRWLLPLGLAGVFGGLALYVYMAARIFPIWLAIPLVILLVSDGQRRWLRVRQAFVFLLALAITALPIAMFYLTNLDVLTDRLSQLAPNGNTPTLLQSVWLHLGMFFIQGDPLLRYNLYPGRPFFDPISGILLVVGLIISGWWLFTRLPAVDRATMGAVLLSPLLVIPSVIAVNGLPPSHMRSVAMVPLIFFAPALGFVWLTQRWQWRYAERVVGVIAVVLIIGLGAWTWRDYEAWGGRADLFYDSDGDLALAADWLEHNAGSVPTIYIASVYYQHPTILASKLDPARLRWLQADHLFVPPPDQDALLIIPRSVQPPSWVDILEPAWQVKNVPLGPDGQPAFTAYHFPTDAQLAIDERPIANIGGMLELQHFDATPASAGEKTQITLVWRILREMGRDDLAPVVTVTDAWDNEITRVQPYFEYSGTWKTGERLVQRLSVPIPAGNPPGEYQVKVTWIGKAKANDYLPVLDTERRFAGVWLTLRGLTVNMGAPTVITVDASAREVMPGLFVMQAPTLPTSIGQGMPLNFAVEWYAQESQLRAAPLTLTAQPSSGEPITLWSGDPVHNTYPINQWRAGEGVIDRYSIRIPPDFPAGEYTVSMTARGAIQPVFAEPLQVEAVERHFDVPTLANPMSIRAGNTIWLRGYEVTRADETHITVTLAWQASQPPDRDYTVFIHVVGPDGTNFTQIDQQPPRPTSQWIANEVSVVTYTLAIPDGAYELRAGMYLQENGLRLPLTDSTGQALGDALTLTPPE